MKSSWLNQEGNDSCILFFNGWGMDEHVLTDMENDEFDVCIFYSYKHISPFNIDLSSYDKIYVIAWSLGVSYAHKVLQNVQFKIAESIAVNGTPYPMHEKFGIPEGIFKHTLERWDQRNRQKFNMRMVGGKSKLELASALMSIRSMEDQQEELQFFYDYNTNFSDSDFEWSKAIVGKGDQIVPAIHQEAYWKEHSLVEVKKWGHFPFNEIRGWEALINNGQ